MRTIFVNYLILKGAENPVDFIELRRRQLMALHDAQQTLAPIGPRQARAVEFGLRKEPYDQFDVQNFAMHELCGMGTRHFRLPGNTNALFGNYSHLRLPTSLATPREQPRNAASARIRPPVVFLMVGRTVGRLERHYRK